MPITQIVPHEGGGAWGWDSDAGKWVGVDPAMAQGSVPGNLMRAAGRGIEDINLGAEQLLKPQPDTQARIKVLDLQKEAASRAAPWTEAIGEGLPDAAAGLAMTPFTGGMSLPGMLAGGAAGGALSGFIRTGTMQERVTNALYGAAAGAAGVGLGEAAVKGVGAAMRVGETIMTRNSANVARGVEVGAQRVQNAADRAAMDAAQTGEAGVSQPGSVGAAATPIEQQGMAHATENAALQLTDETGASGAASDAAMAQRQAVEDMGYQSPAWADTRKGSISRFTGGVNERLPWGQLSQQKMMASNQKHAAKTVGEAMGLQDADVLQSHEIAQAANVNKRGFESIGKAMPEVDGQETADMLKTLRQDFNVFDKGQAQKEIDNAISNLEAHGDTVDGQALMRARSTMSDLMAGYYDKPGTVGQGDIMRQALEKFDEFIAQKAAEKGDKTFAARYQKAREQWQVYSMVKKSGAVSPEGDINPNTLYRAMVRDPADGGFGHAGPRNNGPARRAFDLIDVMRRDQHGVPPTGVATTAALANMGIQGALPMAGLSGGYGILNAVLGNK